MSCIYAFAALPQDRLADTDEYASLKHLSSSLCHVIFVMIILPIQNLRRSKSVFAF